MRPKANHMASLRSSAAASTLAVLSGGFALQMAMWSRQWIYGDQYALLTPAVQYLASGELAPFAKGMSGGGRIPGTLLQLLIATPLRVDADFRAPALLMGVSQLVAVIVLLAVGIAACGDRFAPAFAAVYWLSPWRLYHSGFLWEPGFVLLPAALHLGCCWLLRARPEEPTSDATLEGRASPSRDDDGPVHCVDSTPSTASSQLRLASFGLGAIMVGTLQIHASFVLLALATALLVWRRRIRMRVVSFAVGGATAAVTLLPTVLAFLDGELPQLAPQIDRRVALPLLVISNTGKAVAYWFRMGSADIGRRLRQTAWLADTPPGTEAPFAVPALLMSAIAVLSIASLLVAVYASWRYLAKPAPDTDPEAAGRAWLRDYVVVIFVSVALAGALSPVPVQGWHVLIALHAACIPPALWLADAWRRRGRARWLGAAFVAVLAVTSLLVGLGHPSYLRPAEPQVQQQDIPELLRPLIPAPATNR